MKHLLIRDRAEPGDTIRLGADDRHYLVDVLRLRAGDRLVVLDADSRTYEAAVSRILEDTVEILIGDPGREVGRGWAGELTVWQALPKGRRIDEIIRAVVQAGATRLVPVISERTVVQPREREPDRISRWQRIAREAVQQSGAASPVTIGPVTRLEDIQARADVCLYLHPEPLEQGSLHGYLDRVPKHVELVVGPEGGFSSRETALLSDRGFRPLFLGPRVLRTETAAVFALGAVQILLQEHEAWRLIENRLS